MMRPMVSQWERGPLTLEVLRLAFDRVASSSPAARKPFATVALDDQVRQHTECMHRD
jgi:hypothetical protein